MAKPSGKNGKTVYALFSYRVPYYEWQQELESIHRSRDAAAARKKVMKTNVGRALVSFEIKKFELGD